MNVIFFGSSSREMEGRASVSFIVEDGTSNLLIDCGPGMITGMKKANKQASDINNILLTHVHGDHTSSFAYFVWYRNIERLGKEPPSDLNVYGQKDVLELAKFNLEHMYPEIKWPFNINYHNLSEDSSFKLGSLNIETFEAIHAVPCVGLAISSSNKKVVYSCDSLPNDELLKYSENVDMLIHEGMLMQENEELAKKVKHSTGKDAGKIAKKVNAKMLVLVHIEPDVFGKENELIKEAKEEYDGLITIPTDGTVYNI